LAALFASSPVTTNRGLEQPPASPFPTCRCHGKWGRRFRLSLLGLVSCVVDLPPLEHRSTGASHLRSSAQVAPDR